MTAPAAGGWTPEELFPDRGLTVWSDYVCPFAYVGHRRLARAREAHPDVAVTVLPFEIHPETPPGGVPRDVLTEAAVARGVPMRPGALRELLEEDGIRLHSAPVLVNSRLALQVAEAARDAGCFDAMHDRLFRASFEEAADLGRPEVLADLADEVGLDGAAAVAEAQAFARLDRIVEAIEAAWAAGVVGTPSYRTPGGRVARGVQPVAVLDALLAESA